MWLRDMLPKRFNDARILIYGYDTRLQKGDSVKNIHDIGDSFRHAISTIRSQETVTRPLIILGHSLGGIVIKEVGPFTFFSLIFLLTCIQAMIKMPKGDEQDQSTFNSIAGLLFFGVPNQGMEIKSLVAMVGENRTRFLLETLAPSSRWTQEQSERFRELCPEDIRIATFFETKESPTVIEVIMVAYCSNESALLMCSIVRAWPVA